MTIGQLELPLFGIRSTPDNPVPEQDRTHPAQMVVRHCGNPKPHCSHAPDDSDGPWGCPGVPDLRDHHTTTTVQAWLDANDTIAMPNYYRPMPLSNGVIDHCAAVSNGVRCAWVRHFGRQHSFGDGKETA
jgi:hypothetical protein